MSQRTLPATCADKACGGAVQPAAENANQYAGRCQKCGMEHVVRKVPAPAKGKGKGGNG